MRQLSIALFVGILFFSSCIREEFDPAKYDGSLNLKTGLAAPVGYSHIEIEKYLRDAQASNELRIDESGFLSLYYSANIFSANAGDLISLTPVSQSFSIENTTGATIDIQTPDPGIVLHDTIFIPVSLNLTTGKLDSILLNTGTLVINTVSGNVSGSLSLSFPGIHDNGTPAGSVHSLGGAAENFILNNFMLIPEKGAGDNYFLRCILTLNLEAPSGPIANGAEICGLNIDFNSPEFETIYGNFSGLAIDLPAISLTPGIFSQFLEGHFDFADPKFKLVFSNSFGIPIGISLNQFEVTDRVGQTFPLSGSGIPTPSQPRIIQYPPLTQEGELVADSLVLDKDNSNLPALMEANPDNLSVDASAQVDSIPDGGTGFIRSDSRLDISAVLDLPLWGRAEFLIMQDTLAFDYMSSSLPATEEIERAIIRISTTNGFPVSVIPQAYFLDANGILLDSLFEEPQQLQGASDNNGDGKADPTKMTPIDIDLPRDKIDILEATRFIITRGKVTTTNYPNEDVKFYSDYFLDYNFGLIVQLKINTGQK
jgi:hypothetical protein